ncbi:hypothetical protein EKG37_03805 [Robertmurraya yapensis]|uniref:Uncharacterized protein n=2 Tax=Bacillaceae TaxID=186817 RepID=A0A431WJJ9_9BACI|nr:hypothetical protein [Bacillus yapensis]RTR35767.1 hypothetical protein EKG37_03805 [Bacillus yapensis]TKS98569.1 hypothetical protein FAR12_03805 [Bacillus yapensis]
MSRKQLIITNLILFVIIGFLFSCAVQINSERSFIPLGMVFILLGLSNFLLFLTYQRTRKLVAIIYMIIAASFWVLSGTVLIQGV